METGRGKDIVYLQRNKIRMVEENKQNATIYRGTEILPNQGCMSTTMGGEWLGEMFGSRERRGGKASKSQPFQGRRKHRQKHKARLEHVALRKGWKARRPTRKERLIPYMYTVIAINTASGVLRGDTLPILAL